MAIAAAAQTAVQTTKLTVTVVRLEHTGHVLAALTRATPAPRPAVGQLAGSAFPLAVPGASGLVLVSAELLTVEELSAPPGVLTAPWLWYVDTGGTPPTPQLKQVSSNAPTTVLDAGTLTITSPGDSNAPVLCLVHPTGQWATGTAVSLQVRAGLDANGTARVGNSALGKNDEALVFVRGRPVAVHPPKPGMN